MTGRGGMKIAGDPAALIKNESCCKGILALLIMLSHMHLGGRFIVLGYNLSHFNYLPVGCFFFLSGFGLYEQRKQGREFRFVDKAFRLLLPYWIALIAWSLPFGKTPVTLDYVYRFITGETFLPFGWYVRTQLVCYFIWWVAVNIERQDARIPALAVTLVGLVIYVQGRRDLAVTSTTYITVLCFAGGMLYSLLFERIRRVKGVWLALVELALFAACIFFARFPRENGLRSVLRINVFAFCFSVFVMNLVATFSLRNPVTDFIGKISYELYLVQGIPLCAVVSLDYARRVIYPISNVYLSALVCFTLDFALAMLLWRATRGILAGVKRLGK